ncbi:uncharacterized protein LOC121834885, partial [Ixodes scapularis]|uniref:uncharacterized protein LOC121834885 n=1 Tax=Ixodes scapularis TaxID=6945 RepID=UPI001C38F3FB
MPILVLETIRPKVIMGTETWLHDSVSNCEVFPPGFSVYRKDRNGHGGGVCLLISSDWSSSELVFSENDTESVWCRVVLPKGTTLVFGTFYRPPDSDAYSIDKLGDLLTTIPDSVFLGGDFNLPGFNWSDEVLATDGPRAYSMFADIISVFGFEQYVKKPTRENSVLDLILCNFPGVVSEVTVLPG